MIVPSALAVLWSVAFQGGSASIVNTKHNLSPTGPGPIRASDDTELCIFCHTPHNAGAGVPLWNRSDTTVSFLPYDSSTFKATPGQPSLGARLCLSCHDGSIALGALLSQSAEVQFEGGVRFLDESTGALGWNLQDDHPFSFLYAESWQQSQEFVPPQSIPPPVRLDPTGQVQCTSCHDPHSDLHGKFLHFPQQRGQLCLACHTPAGFGAASHALSPAGWNGSGLDPWPFAPYRNVADNACANCHRPHYASSLERLLVFPLEEDNCLRCHNGNVATHDIASLLALPAAHDPQSYSGVHDPAENPFSMNSHVECVDCHNPHAANGLPGTAPFVPGPLAGAAGVSGSSQPVDPATYGYEVCYRCHHTLQGSWRVIPRQIVQTNVILEFDPANPSYHPVEAAGRNPFVPSLLPPWTTASIVYCWDCHNSDASPRFGGSGPDGPHGTLFQPLLGADYRTADFTVESPAAYALCYRCHSRNSILDDRSFKKHEKHVVDKSAPCSACHDPHGISSSQGDPLRNSHLINFDLSIVGPDPQTGRLEFNDLGNGRGQCYLSCHGEDHSPEEY